MKSFKVRLRLILFSILIVMYSSSSVAAEKCGRVISLQFFSDEPSTFVISFDKIEDEKGVGISVSSTPTNINLAMEALNNSQSQLCFDESFEISIRYP